MTATAPEPTDEATASVGAPAAPAAAASATSVARSRWSPMVLLSTYGPLASQPISGRINSDVSRWATGGKGCKA